MKCLAVSFMLSLAAWAQDAKEIVDFSLDSGSVQSLRPGGEYDLRFIVSVGKGWHLFANKIKDKYLIPTSLELKEARGVTVLAIRYPRGTEKTFFGIAEPLYEGRVEIPVRVRAQPSERLGFAAVLKYQPCNDRMCLPPAEKRIDVSRSFPAGSPLLPGRGTAAVLFFLFLSGILLNLTPCVYPVIPITLSFFAGQSSGSRARTGLLALCYVLGIALMYSGLGVLAALSGGIMGSALQHPAVLWGIAALFGALSLSMFGLYEIRVPAFLSALGVGRKGAAGAFAMGLIVGIVAAPCVGPVTAGLLLHVAEKRDAGAGFLYFLFLSLGLGLPYFFLAFFSAQLRRLPGSGGWMVWVRKFFGFVLLAMAVYYARPLLSRGLAAALFLLLGVSAAAYLGFLEKSAAGRFPAFRRFQRLFGLCLLVVAIMYFTGERSNSAVAEASGGRKSVSLAEYEVLRASGRPFVIDFRADWCAPCRKFEAEVLSDSAVRKALERTPLFTVDLTVRGDGPGRRMAEMFKIAGVPTVVFIDRTGAESGRVTEFIGTERFLEKLRALAGEESP